MVCYNRSSVGYPVTSLSDRIQGNSATLMMYDILMEMANNQIRDVASFGDNYGVFNVIGKRCLANTATDLQQSD
jgi:hypothetical protein